MDKYLIIQTAYSGDAILTLPLIQKIKEISPESELHVLAIPATFEIFSSSPFVDKVLIIDKKGKHKKPSGLLKFIREIRKNDYARIYSPHRSLRSSLIVLGLGVKETFGFSTSRLKHVYKNLIKYDFDHHEVRRNLDLIGYGQNGSDWKILPEIKCTEEGKEKVNSYFTTEKLGIKTAAVAPGSIWNTKKYPAEYFGIIISSLGEMGYRTIIIGSEKDKEVCITLNEKNKSCSLSAAGLFSVPETVELLRRVKILISNDSAPAHMGLAADIPVLMLYCSTVPDFGFYPYSEKSSYLSYSDLPCKPCGIHGHDECPVKTFDCGKKLEPQEVILKIKEMLNDQN